MEMVPEEKHRIINYGSEQSADRLDSLLNRMTPEEEICRRYYRMEQGLEEVSPEESAGIRRAYQEVINRYFQTHTGEPYGTRENVCTLAAPIVVRKRGRYFPQVQYCCRHFEFIYVYSGQCELICKGSQYELRRGDFCLLEYGAPHCILNHTDGCILIEVCLLPEMMNQICALLLGGQSILSHFFRSVLYGKSNYPMITFHTGDHQAVKKYTLAMLNTPQNADPVSRMQMEAFLNILFVLLLRYFPPEQAQPVALDGGGIPEIMEYINEHYLDVTLRSLAEAFGYSDSHMSKLISTSCQMPFSDLIRRIRMRHAAWLLRNTNLPVTQIAAEVRCIDTSHFGKNFRKEFGMAPREYRQIFSVTEAGYSEF